MLHGHYSSVHCAQHQQDVLQFRVQMSVLQLNVEASCFAV